MHCIHWHIYSPNWHIHVLRGLSCHFVFAWRWWNLTFICYLKAATIFFRKGLRFNSVYIRVGWTWFLMPWCYRQTVHTLSLDLSPSGLEMWNCTPSKSENKKWRVALAHQQNFVWFRIPVKLHRCVRSMQQIGSVPAIVMSTDSNFPLGKEMRSSD